MKFLFLLLLILFISADSPKTETFDLEIMVTNINTPEGSIEMGVFNSPKTFLRIGKEYKTYSQKVENETVIFLLKDIKKGDYAISIYHDVNSDHKCNLGFLGIPEEPYGFSKNFRPILSKPTFNDCKINANQIGPVIIRLID